MLIIFYGKTGNEKLPLPVNGNRHYRVFTGFSLPVAFTNPTPLVYGLSKNSKRFCRAKDKKTTWSLIVFCAFNMSNQNHFYSNCFLYKIGMGDNVELMKRCGGFTWKIS